MLILQNSNLQYFVFHFFFFLFKNMYCIDIVFIMKIKDTNYGMKNSEFIKESIFLFKFTKFDQIIFMLYIKMLINMIICCNMNFT